MDDRGIKLRKRLEKIWQSPDFFKVFAAISKRAPHTIKKGTIIFNTNDPLERLYYIVKGFVKLYQLSEEGKDTTVYLLGTNNIIGVRALTSQDKLARHNAEALTDISVLTISHKEYFDALVNHPQYCVDLLHVFIDRLNYTERKLESFIYADTTARVANFLSDCAQRFGIKKGSIIEVPLELTHQRIAEFVGSFRETVTLALHYLEKTGTVKDEKKRITIYSLNKLNTFALTGRKHLK